VEVRRVDAAREVRSGAERGPGARDDDRPHRVLHVPRRRVRRLDGLAQGGAHLGVERVAGGVSVEGDNGYGTVPAALDHGGFDLLVGRGGTAVHPAGRGYPLRMASTVRCGHGTYRSSDDA